MIKDIRIHPLFPQRFCQYLYIILGIFYMKSRTAITALDQVGDTGNHFILHTRHFRNLRGDHLF